MSQRTELGVYRHGRQLASIALDDKDPPTSPPAIVEETWKCGFILRGREPDVEYQIRVGDWPLDQIPLFQEADGYDALYAMDEVRWPEGPIFDSARGRSLVEIRSRSENTPEPWKRRGRLEVIVSPTKLGEEHYQGMLQDLRRVAWGLIFDLTSKSLGGIDLRPGTARPSVESNQVELRLMMGLWERLQPLLIAIADSPATALERTTQPRHCWGNERLGGKGLARLAARGVDPRVRSVARPFRAFVDVLEERTDMYEHRLIASFLDELRARLHECVVGADRQANEIEQNRRFRDHQPTGGINLFQLFDIPRRERLIAARQTALAISESIAGLRRSAPFNLTGADLPGRRTPIFEHVPAYRRAHSLIQEHLDLTSVVLEEGMEEQLKATWRLYEQWVFLQLVGACRELLLDGPPVTSLFRRIARGRFTLDLDRGATVDFLSVDGRTVRFQYEPWIHDRSGAREAGATVYRHGGGQEWSPDILMQVLPRGAARMDLAAVDYGLVFDAKYSVRVTDQHWERTRKYFDIHATHNRRQIVRQVWLIHPGTNEEASFRDPGLRWYDDGPDIGPEEAVHGRLPLLPQGEYETMTESTLRVSPQAARFMTGILAFLKFPEGLPKAFSGQRQGTATP